jgi:hypothetical protein
MFSSLFERNQRIFLIIKQSHCEASQFKKKKKTRIDPTERRNSLSVQPTIAGWIVCNHSCNNNNDNNEAFSLSCLIAAATLANINTRIQIVISFPNLSVCRITTAELHEEDPPLRTESNENDRI